MAVMVSLHFVALMDVIVWTMITGVIVIMEPRIAMVVSVLMLVAMLMAVGVRVFMSVL